MTEEEQPVNPYTEMYQDFSLSDLAQAQRDIKQALEKAKKEVTEIQSHFDALRLHVLPEKMEDMGISSVKVNGVGRLTVTGDLYAGIVPGKQVNAYKWLEDNGHGDLVKDFVHSSTLKAFLKEQIKGGVEFPDELFKVTPFERASITKS